MKKFIYGMRLRGFSVGAQPMKGIVEALPDHSEKYHNILIYSRKLSRREMEDYELDYIGGDEDE